ncbi:MAG: hypothetical protein RMK93_08910 [Bacteroidota bacterium]|nr:hypothetical protein [Bacteroidota bacterium]
MEATRQDKHFWAVLGTFREVARGLAGATIENQEEFIRLLDLLLHTHFQTAGEHLLCSAAIATSSLREYVALLKKDKKRIRRRAQAEQLLQLFRETWNFIGMLTGLKFVTPSQSQVLFNISIDALKELDSLCKGIKKYNELREEYMSSPYFSNSEEGEAGNSTSLLGED